MNRKYVLLFAAAVAVLASLYVLNASYWHPTVYARYGMMKYAEAYSVVPYYTSAGTLGYTGIFRIDDPYSPYQGDSIYYASEFAVYSKVPSEQTWYVIYGWAHAIRTGELNEDELVLPFSSVQALTNGTVKYYCRSVSVPGVPLYAYPVDISSYTVYGYSDGSCSFSGPAVFVVISRAQYHDENMFAVSVVDFASGAVDTLGYFPVAPTVSKVGDMLYVSGFDAQYNGPAVYSVGVDGAHSRVDHPVVASAAGAGSYVFAYDPEHNALMYSQIAGGGPGAAVVLWSQHGPCVVAVSDLADMNVYRIWYDGVLHSFVGLAMRGVDLYSFTLNPAFCSCSSGCVVSLRPWDFFEGYGEFGVSEVVVAPGLYGDSMMAVALQLEGNGVVYYPGADRNYLGNWVAYTFLVPVAGVRDGSLLKDVQYCGADSNSVRLKVSMDSPNASWIFFSFVQDCGGRPVSLGVDLLSVYNSIWYRHSLWEHGAVSFAHGSDVEIVVPFDRPVYDADCNHYLLVVYWPADAAYSRSTYGPLDYGGAVRVHVPSSVDGCVSLFEQPAQEVNAVSVPSAKKHSEPYVVVIKRRSAGLLSVVGGQAASILGLLLVVFLLWVAYFR